LVKLLHKQRISATIPRFALKSRRLPQRAAHSREILALDKNIAWQTLKTKP
jgi:hypothetical protein